LRFTSSLTDFNSASAISRFNHRFAIQLSKHLEKNPPLPCVDAAADRRAGPGLSTA
jgi:hypothetical protein